MPDVKYERLPVALRAEVGEMRKFLPGGVNSPEGIRQRFLKLHAKLALKYNLSFIQYVRLLDPSVPTASSGWASYKDHKVYQWALYRRKRAS